MIEKYKASTQKIQKHGGKKNLKGYSRTPEASSARNLLFIYPVTTSTNKKRHIT